MPQVMVADVLCGGGKTSSAINFINASPSAQKFLFVTPYLDECERVIQNCSGRKFVQPAEERFGKQCTKLSDMRQLLFEKQNIASTHALFPHYTTEMLQVLRDNHYTLIIDEAYDMTKPLEQEERQDFFDELEKGTLAVDDECRVSWVASPPSPGSSLQELYAAITNGSIYLYGKNLLLWLFPKEILMAFDRIIVLTYMFDAQTMRYYFDAIGLAYTYVGTKYTDTGYQFCSTNDPDMIMQHQLVKGKIEILNKPKLNRIGDTASNQRERQPLSASWFKADEKNNDSKGILELARNIRNVQKNIYKCPQSEFMWTVFKKYKDVVADKNLKKTFVPMNQRAVNKYRQCKYLAYGINRYAQPDAYNYFRYMGVVMDVKRWALSEMIQWIWRSAIRDGEDIYIYIPSERMRNLLSDWIDEVSSGVVGGAVGTTVSPNHYAARDEEASAAKEITYEKHEINM